MINQPKGSKWSKAKNQSHDFIKSLETLAMNRNVLTCLKELSKGPNIVVKRYSNYLINGYKFHTR